MENTTRTIGEITKIVESSSTAFEKSNTELKRKYLLWNIDAFNILAHNNSFYKGSFGTGYPFYALDEKLQGALPIIQEQIRYNRQLVQDGEIVANSIWECESCLKRNYSTMPDLKRVCKPCPNMLDNLKPRKLINRLPDMDLWLICEDGKVEQAQNELGELLDKYLIRTSDYDPVNSIFEVANIAKKIKNGEFPNMFLPIDTHIIEETKLQDLINKVPGELKHASINHKKPYLPIHPKSYRKNWQYDDEAYNYIYDFLSAFTIFDGTSEELKEILENTRKNIALEFDDEQLFKFLLQSATTANYRRFQTEELENIFKNKMQNWRNLKTKDEKQIEDEER